MIFVVVGLAALVLWLAHRSDPGVPSDTVQPLEADVSLPSLGATGTFAPTLTGGSPLIARDNRTRLGMRYTNAQPVTSRQILAQMTPGSTVGVFGLTDASASGSFLREDSPQLTQQAAVFQPRPAGKLQRFKF